MQQSQQLQPRNGGRLKVLVVARISGCQNQKELSLDDQLDHAKQEVFDMFRAPADFDAISTINKGEWLDRKELPEIEERLRSGDYDVMIMEDVGRLVRGAAAVEIWGIAVDNGVRCIAPNDGCDSANPTWEEDLMSACKDHVSHCAHTSRRIKHKQMNRFKRNGAVLPLVVFGYIKPEGAKAYSQLQKDETATPHLKSGLEVLRSTKCWMAVADHFNRQGLKTGPYCRSDHWTGVMVKRLYENPILKGMPQRGARHSVKKNSNGRRISVVNPAGPTYREEPHLAHFDKEELESVLQEVHEVNAKRRRGPKPNGASVSSTRRSRFPGRRATCAYCGRRLLWGGNGLNHNLMCQGAKQYQCWNSFGVNGKLVTTRIVAAITAELVKLEGFDAQFAEILQATQALNAPGHEESDAIEAEYAELVQQKSRLQDSILASGPRQFLNDILDNLEQKEAELDLRRSQLAYRLRRRPQIPSSGSELRERFQKALGELALESLECSDLLRDIVSEMQVYVVRLIDGGYFLPRVKATLSLGGLIPNIENAPELQTFLTREVTIDAFEAPIRERIREHVAQRVAEGHYQRVIAAELGTHQVTVQKAFTLHQMMTERGLTDPYEVIYELPRDEKNKKLKRSRHDRFEFQPLKGHVFPEL